MDLKSNEKQIMKIAKVSCKLFSNEFIAGNSQDTPLLIHEQSSSLSENYSILKEHNLTALSNFCIYMGEWTNNSENRINQQSILSQFELIVINPKSKGRFNHSIHSLYQLHNLLFKGIELLKRCQFSGKYIIAAIKVDYYYLPPKTTENTDQTEAINSFCSRIIIDIFSILQKMGDSSSFYDGIYLECFDSLPTIQILAPIAEIFQSRGILVFMSLKSPTFNAHSLPDPSFFNGFFLQNATMNTDGTRKDYFDLIPHFHNLIKTYTEQVVYRKDFVCFIEEKISEEGYLQLDPTLVNRYIYFWGLLKQQFPIYIYLHIYSYIYSSLHLNTIPHFHSLDSFVYHNTTSLYLGYHVFQKYLMLIKSRNLLDR